MNRKNLCSLLAVTGALGVYFSQRADLKQGNAKKWMQADNSEKTLQTLLLLKIKEVSYIPTIQKVTLPLFNLIVGKVYKTLNCNNFRDNS